MQQPTKGGAGCLVLFALPFAGAGLFAAFQVLKQLQEGPSDWRKLTLLSIFALVFTGVGGGLIVAARYGQSKVGEATKLQEMHPGVPWMWKPDWASGRIVGSNKNTMVFAWVFAIFWNLVSAPILFIFPEEYFDKGNQAALIGLLFPVIGVGLLVWALRATARWRKFGSSMFEMSSVPGVIGGRLRGTIQTALQSPPESGVRLTLNCIRRIERQGKNNSTRESILWQDERTVPRERLHPSYQGLSAAVDFHVPYECKQTDGTNPSNQILWRLRADAAVAGVDYSSHFEVPVFKTAQSSPETPADDRFASFSTAVSEPFDPRRATVRVRPSALGGTEYYFGAARNLRAAFSVTVFFLIFGGAIWLQLHFGAPWIFPAVTALFELLLLLIMIDLWLSTTRVTIESGKVRVKRSTLGIGSNREIPCSEISEVKLGTSMQQQETLTQAGKVYYDIEIHRKHGKKVKAGCHLRDKREAEWLRAEMKKQIEAFHQ